MSDRVLEALDAVEERWADDLREAQVRMLSDLRGQLEGDRVAILRERPGSGKTWLLRRIARVYGEGGRVHVLFSTPSPDLAEREVKRFRDDWGLRAERWRDVSEYECRVSLDVLLGDRLSERELLRVYRDASRANDLPKCHPEFYRKDGPLLGRIGDEELRERVREALYRDNPYVHGFAPWDECEECEAVRQLRSPARIVCLSFDKLLSVPFLYASHERVREVQGKEPLMTLEDWREVLEGALVVLDDAHMLPGALVVEVPGYVPVGGSTLEGRLDGLAMGQEYLWRVVDWGQDVRNVKEALRGEVLREVRDVLVRELEDWLEELRDRIVRDRNAGYLHARKQLSLLNELVNRAEELGVREWVAVRSPRRGGSRMLTFAPVIESLDQLLGLLMGPDLMDLPEAYLAAENRPTLSELRCG